MAERDVMLVAIEMDASGAIKDTEVLDRKFTSLGSTFQKGQKRAEGAEKAQKKLTKSIKEGGNATAKANVQTITNLALMEAATSGLNQGISAQYKSIDAKLASGKITEEEAEKERKVWKARERHTARLETAIAVLRLWTVTKAIATTVTVRFTAATDANTTAVNANTAAMLKNPWVAVAVGIAAVLYGLYIFNKETGKVTDMVEGLNKALRDLIETFTSLGGLLDDNPLRKLVESDTMAGINNALRLESLGVG